MILDKLLQLSDSQALTTTAVSTNVIDLGEDRNIGIGTSMSILVCLEAAADDADGDETYSAVLQTATDEAFTSPVEVISRAIPAGAAVGSKYVLPLPADLGADRFLRLNFVLGGTTPGVTVSAYLVPTDHIQNMVYYKDNITIS